MTFLSEGLKGLMGSKSLTLQENAPNILFGVGVLSMIGSTILACRSTLKLESVLEEGQKKIAEVKAAEINEKYSERDQKQDISVLYLRTAGNVLKLYAPAILLGGCGVASLSKSHNILLQRNAALIAAYNAVDLAFKQYRSRVKERYGEDVDREMRYGSEKVEITNPDTGRKQNVKRVGPDTPSMYACFFDQINSSSWSKHPESNWIFLRNKQRYLNELLIARGHLFLNEAYRELGLPNTQAGAIVGWRMEEGVGDHFVDLGLFRDDEKINEFLSGRQGAILLDFNVDGVIFDKLDTPPPPLRWQED